MPRLHSPPTSASPREVQRHVRRTSHLIAKLDERELVRRSRPAARQGCCALGRGAAWRFDWADTGQDDNKRASRKHP